MLANSRRKLMPFALDVSVPGIAVALSVETKYRQEPLTAASILIILCASPLVLLLLARLNTPPPRL